MNTVLIYSKFQYSYMLDSIPGEIPKRSNGADCKSVGISLRRFESCSPHTNKVRYILYQHIRKTISGSSSVGRASAFQAEGRGFESRLPLNTCKSRLANVAQLVEHFHGKEGVTGSSPVIGSLHFYNFIRILFEIHNFQRKQ